MIDFVATYNLLWFALTDVNHVWLLNLKSLNKILDVHCYYENFVQ